MDDNEVNYYKGIIAREELGQQNSLRMADLLVSNLHGATVLMRIWQAEHVDHEHFAILLDCVEEGGNPQDLLNSWGI